jgi:hypothetical protein
MIPLTTAEITRLLALPAPPGAAVHWLTSDAATRPAPAGTTSAHDSPRPTRFNLVSNRMAAVLLDEPALAHAGEFPAGSAAAAAGHPPDAALRVLFPGPWCCIVPGRLRCFA